MYYAHMPVGGGMSGFDVPRKTLHTPARWVHKVEKTSFNLPKAVLAFGTSAFRPLYTPIDVIRHHFTSNPYYSPLKNSWQPTNEILLL